MLIDAHQLLIFVLACLALILTPGPDMALTLTRGMTQGFRMAALSVAGTWSAGLVQIPAVVLGLAAVFQHSPMLFVLVKLLGAAYLGVLGARALLRSLSRTAPPTPSGAPGARDAYWQGFLTNLLNPKVFIFMTAFLPQFTDPAAGSLWQQLLVLAVVSKTLGLAVGLCMAFAAARIRGWLARNAWFVRLQEGVLGSVMLLVSAVLVFDRGSALPVASR